MILDTCFSNLFSGDNLRSLKLTVFSLAFVFNSDLHFKPHFNPSTTEKIKCQCEDGYYCMNDDDCDVCRKHTVCKPGQRVIKKGLFEVSMYVQNHWFILILS